MVEFSVRGSGRLGKVVMKFLQGSRELEKGGDEIPTEVKGIGDSGRMRRHVPQSIHCISSIFDKKNGCGVLRCCVGDSGWKRSESE